MQMPTLLHICATNGRHIRLMKALRHSVALLVFGVTFGACSRESPLVADAPEAAPVVSETVETTTLSTPPSNVEGWPTPVNADGKLPLAPDFSANDLQGETVSQDSLRGRWTILAFWGLWSEDSLADFRYMQALERAAGQDPDLQFLSVHTTPVGAASTTATGGYLSIQQGLDDQGAVRLRTLIDADGAIASAFGATSVPTYFLIGPDLTIEAQRGAVHIDETDGIKPIIRGIADIRSQITSP